MYDYSSVVTFGGCQDDLLLVVRCERRHADRSENLRFLMSKPNVRIQNLLHFVSFVYFLLVLTLTLFSVLALSMQLHNWFGIPS